MPHFPEVSAGEHPPVREEILPNGDTMLSAGDRIIALADGGRSTAHTGKMLDLTGVCPPEAPVGVT